MRKLSHSGFMRGLIFLVGSVAQNHLPCQVRNVYMARQLCMYVRMRHMCNRSIQLLYKKIEPQFMKLCDTCYFILTCVISLALFILK